MIVVLAHGALGVFDELIFFAVGIVFLVMMAISWIRSRNAPLDIEDETAPEISVAESPDRFKLD
jgi:hypothetical protein